MNEWRTVSLGSISFQRKGINYKSDDYSNSEDGHPFVTIKCFVKGGGYEPTGIKFYKGFSTKADQLAPGDLLYAVTDLTRAGDIVGSPLRVPEFGSAKPALASMDCMRIEPDASQCDKRFMYHLLMLADVRGKMVAYSAGSTVLHLDTKRVPEFLIRIPADTRIQAKIARVLDSIDTAIEKTEALIAKHQQIKAGLMHDLFTRGVLPNGQLRPPRSEAPELYQETAIGWIPEDWQLTTLRQCLTDSPTNGIYKPAEQIGEGLLMVGQTAFTERRSIDFTLCRRGAVDKVESHRYGLAKDDILVTRVFATVEGVGLPTLVPQLVEPAVFESNMMRLRIDASIVKPRLLFEWLQSPIARRHITGGANASNQCSVNQGVLNPLPVVLPPQDEQTRITVLIEQADRHREGIIESLSRLKMQKLGLMQDLLTGRVPVPVPAEPAEVAA